MDVEQRQQLREMALRAPQTRWRKSGPWVHFEETDEVRGGPAIQAHKNKHWNKRIAAYIAAAQPSVLIELLDYIDDLETQLEGKNEAEHWAGLSDAQRDESIRKACV